MRRLTRPLITSALATLLLGGVLGHTAERSTPAPPAVDEAEQALKAIADKHGTTPQKLLQAMMEKQLEQRDFLKGGVALVGEEIFAVPGEERNKLILGARRETWLGAPRSQSELVLIANQSVVGTISLPKGVAPRNLNFVWFQPEKAFYLDGESFEAGHLIRLPPQK